MIDIYSDKCYHTNSDYTVILTKEFHYTLVYNYKCHNRYQMFTNRFNGPKIGKIEFYI